MIKKILLTLGEKLFFFFFKKAKFLVLNINVKDKVIMRLSVL